MRVPIENGSGLSTRVSDFIKLSAAYWTAFIIGSSSYFKFTAGCFFITRENTVNVFTTGQPGYL